MKITRLLMVLICSAMFAGLVYAEDAAPAKKEPTSKPAKVKPVRLTKPWSLLDDLTADQKDQINKIHVEALDEKKKIDDKEEADCNAVLTDAQKEELQKIEEKEKADMKEKNKTEKKKDKATTKPD